MSVVTRDYNSIKWNELFYYDPSSPTGLCWKVDRTSGRWNKIFTATAGSWAGSVHHDKKKDHYSTTVSYGSKNWFSARIVWILHNGELSNDLCVDHINNNPVDNRIENIRVVEQVLNNRNTVKRNDNNTGITGVHFTTSSGKEGSHTYATASWYSLPNSREQKHFPTKKLGLLPAFAYACAYREQKIKELNQAGFGYTNNHGK